MEISKQELQITSDTLTKIANKCVELSDDKGWHFDWRGGGVYAHLETSEFIEALRGKQGVPHEEAADTLLSILGMMAYNHININDMINYLNKLVTK